MSEARALLGHSAVYALAAVLSRGGSFLLLPLYTRFLDPSDFGLLGVITITSEVVGAFIGAKLGTAMSRLVFDHLDPRRRDELVTTAILGLLALVGASSVIVVLVAKPLSGVLLGSDRYSLFLVLGVVGLLLNVVFTLGLQHLIVGQRSQAVLVATTLRSLAHLLLSVLFVALLDLGVLGALLGVFLANALAVAGLVLPLLARLGPRFSRTDFLTMLGFGLPLLPGQLAELLVRFADRYLLVHLASLASAGVFFLAQRITSILPLLLTSPFNQVYVVRRFEAHGRRDEDPEAPRLFTYFFAAFVSFALGLSLLAPELVALLAFGRPPFWAAATMIPLLALAEAIRAVLLIVEVGIFQAKIPRYLTMASLVTLTFHVPLTALFIGRWGAVGAATALVASTSFRLALTSRLARNLGGPRPEWARLLAILAAGLLGFGATWAIERGMGPAWGLAGRLLMAALFPLLMLGSPIFGTNERQVLRSFVTDRIARFRSAPGVG